jgi:beta-lactamase class A
MIKLLRVFGLLMLFLAAPASADDPPGTTPFRERGEQLVGILSSNGGEEAFFAASFLAAVPKAQISDIAKQLIAQNGPVRGVRRIGLVSATTGEVDIAYEKAVVRFNMTIDGASPHQVVGLLVAAVNATGDSPSKISAEVSALPGKAGMLIRRIDGPQAPPIIAVNADTPFAIGSSFKLWLLAEAARSVGAGERQWSSVIPLGTRSVPSGITQKWPQGAPMTLHSLATLMISISDNTATDTLLSALGRERVGKMVGATGHANPAKTLPLLSTRELFAMKMNASADLRDAWLAGGPKERATLLKANATRLSESAIDAAQLVGKPRNIDAIEWFASPSDMSRTLDWFRTTGDKDARDILAVNPGLAPGAAARFAYVGYKGGSETGVISMNLLIQTKAGAWFSVTGSWNNQDAAIDENKFVALVTRAVALVP